MNSQVNLLAHDDIDIKNKTDDGMSLPRDNIIGPNCGVTCVAIASNVSFEKAWFTLIKMRFPAGSRRPSRLWKGATSHTNRVAALKELGVNFTELKFNKKFTLKTFIEKHASRGKLYMVNTTGHVQMVKDGLIVDQNGKNTLLTDYWRKKRRVKNVLLI